ncbi:MAG: MerR family transcriptional regulator [Chitinophagales bacterium]|nr:MerR family transcriptional regulator [Chitinophagales bacterium]
MAKKLIQQLDLFTNIETPATAENTYQQKQISTIVSEKNDLVYANEKIGVKIKIKKKPKTIIEKKEKQKPTSNKNKRGRKSFKEMDEEIELINIPDDETLKKKLYYPIREVAAFFNVNTSLIRMWETEFDILQPRKNRKGDRLFRFEDIKNLQIIYYLLRNKKFSIDGAKKYLKENKGKLDSKQQLLHSLKKIKNFLLDIKAEIKA